MMSLGYNLSLNLLTWTLPGDRRHLFDLAFQVRLPESETTQAMKKTHETKPSSDLGMSGGIQSLLAL